jgi:hypothetical protein
MLESTGRRALVCFGRRGRRFHGLEVPVRRKTSLGLLRQAAGSDSGKRPRTRLAGPGAALWTRGRIPACRAMASGLQPTDPTPSGGGSRVQATKSTRPACWLRVQTPRARSSVYGFRTRLPREAVSEARGQRVGSHFGGRRTGVQGRQVRRQLAGGRRCSRRVRAPIPRTTGSNLRTTSRKLLRQPTGSDFTDERLGSTGEERDSVWMTAPIPRRTCWTSSEGSHDFQGRDFRRRFAGLGCRIHGCDASTPPDAKIDASLLAESFGFTDDGR